MSGKKKLIAKTKYFLDKSRIDNISAISAQSAFFLVLSIVPFLMFAFAVLSFFNIPDNVYEAYIKQAFPTELNNYLKDFISTAYDNSVGVAFTTIIAALWSAGKGMYSITEGINRIYKIRKKQLWIIKRVFAMGYTLLMFLALVAAVVLLMIGEFFDGFICDTPGFTSLSLEDQGVHYRDVLYGYPEITRIATGCRFDDCSHRKEDGCVVRNALADGLIDEGRYERYKSFYTELYDNRNNYKHRRKQ